MQNHTGACTVQVPRVRGLEEQVLRLAKASPYGLGPMSKQGSLKCGKGMWKPQRAINPGTPSLSDRLFGVAHVLGKEGETESFKAPQHNKGAFEA